MPPPTYSTAFHPSPKRKREQHPPPIPLLNTALRTASTPTPPQGSPAPDSPRNAVADQLRGMSLAAIPMYPLSPTDDVVKKKPKLDGIGVGGGTSLDEHLLEAKTKSQRKQVKMQDPVAVNEGGEASRVIAETPQPLIRQPRIFSDMVSFAQQPTAFVSSSATTPIPQQPTISKQTTETKNHSQHPRDRNSSPSPPLSSLTWKDSEITGHLVGPATDPDDDGTGLNGIGFRPTPAIAYARAQKRRQQVLDWKAREAREARAKRSERRRRGVGGASSREATVERELRAAEPVVSQAGRSVKFSV
ncbi:hypothetical protein P280DRAFT_474795 [Massarina eburnea CBS 473.64]|uniref:Uncharacterized protein n=1 Tax=Massarina eburnea CBS 473.64 TaxID=1395130 RepID=A0A6A6RJS1_9PLEO|nr:hypothetical protein P280DRAFT_474795 [Massarina eburnea CBS 473.64]